jgi:hypothetical protein
MSTIDGVGWIVFRYALAAVLIYLSFSVYVRLTVRIVLILLTSIEINVFIWISENNICFIFVQRRSRDTRTNGWDKGNNTGVT